MKLFDLTIPLIIVVVMVCAVVGLISDKFLGEDNPVEQDAEAIIRSETGLNIDLSPSKITNKS